MSPYHRSLLAFTLTTALLVCGLTTAFNLVVDPYGSYRIVELAKYAPRPAIYNKVKLAKAYDIRRIRPQAIVLGSSRSHIGLRMTHEGWSVPPEARYNAAFDSATTKEMYAYLLHAYAVNPLRQVVLGLDYSHLKKEPAWVQSDFQPTLLFEPARAFHNAAVYTADIALLLSVDTSAASVARLGSLGEKENEWLASDGQRIGAKFFREVLTNFSESPGAYFRDIDRKEIGYQFATGPTPRGRTQYRPENSSSTLTSLDYIAKIVSFCREKDTDLRIFITPSHAHHLEITAELGVWPSLEQGKRDLVKLLAEDTRRHPGARPFPLFDFAGYSSVTTERVPPDTSTEEMKFYWDSSHFKERVGDWVLDRLFDVVNKDDPAPLDFGARLTAMNIDNELARTRSAQLVYRNDDAEEIALLRSLIQEAKPKPTQYVKAE